MAKFWHPTGGKMTDIDLHADIESSATMIM
jgi:hypothetical protein